ncbi:MAG: hypothetical protein EXR69_05790 [Myxococcales bacterium]|nr:hypothetical protein [Myxococcales bacterium]
MSVARPANLCVLASLLTASLLIGGCGVPVSDPFQTQRAVAARSEAAIDVAVRWPSYQAAMQDDEVAWFPTHVALLQGGAVASTGMGVSVARMDQATLLHPLDATHDLYEPNMLFFDAEGGSLPDAVIIGFGYFVHEAFDPAVRPDVEFVDPDWFLIHEAGYHLSWTGGFELATDEDLMNASTTAIDPGGCNRVTDDDLQTHFTAIKHGRAWSSHLWIDPDGGEPEHAALDPFYSIGGVDLPDSAFYEQDCEQFVASPVCEG